MLAFSSIFISSFSVIAITTQTFSIKLGVLMLTIDNFRLWFFNLLGLLDHRYSHRVGFWVSRWHLGRCIFDWSVNSWSWVVSLVKIQLKGCENLGFCLQTFILWLFYWLKCCRIYQCWATLNFPKWLVNLFCIINKLIEFGILLAPFFWRLVCISLEEF